MTWTTRLEHTGEVEIHSAWFIPRGHPGRGACLTLGIPECELIFTWSNDGKEAMSLVNSPPPNARDVDHCLTAACSMIRDYPSLKVALFINCDTAEQVAEWAPKVLALLPDYKRMPLERFYAAESRVDQEH